MVSPRRYNAVMSERTPEDQLIRTLVILTSTGAVLGLLAVGTVITVMVSANFNILNWME
jgi:hypothetical protein